MSIQLRDSSGLLNKVAGTPEIDAILSSTSTNAIQNKSVYAALAQKVEKSVSDLVNYYDKSQVYNKTEVRQLIGSINTVTIEVVATLPTSQISSTTIYFVGPATGTNTYEEYVYVNSTWVKIGDTDIDLTQYVTSANLTTILQDYYTKSAMDALLDSYYTKTEADAAFQAALTFDSTPTTGSTNPVTSSGIKTALDEKQDTLTFDTTPTALSTNPVTSAGIKTAVDDKVSWAAIATLGVHNILPFPYLDGSSKTDNGITFTVNSDGSVLATGTATGGNANFTLANLASIKTFMVDGEHYILSGCPEGGGYDKYRLEYSNWVDRGYEDYGQGVTLTKFADSYSNQKVNIRIEQGQVLPSGGLLYKPMVRLAADTNTTYAQYAMSNKKLTDSVQLSAMTPITSSSSKYTVAPNVPYRQTGFIKIGHIVFVRLVLDCVTPVTSPGDTWETIASNILPKPSAGLQYTWLAIGSSPNSTVMVDDLYILIQEHNIYARWGTASKLYEIDIVYPTDE